MVVIDLHPPVAIRETPAAYLAGRDCRESFGFLS